VKTDTIGPASYEPSNFDKKTNPKANFQASKIKRQVFAPSKHADNMYPPTDNPGPGQYNSTLQKSRKDFNSNGESSVFVSKVPNCKDKIDNSATGKLDPGHYYNSETCLTVKGKGPSCVFVSKTAKGEVWMNHPSAPFTKNNSFVTPGPGMYGVKRKKDDLKKKILNEDTVKVPFGIGDVRDFNKKKTEDIVPGPG